MDVFAIIIIICTAIVVIVDGVHTHYQKQYYKSLKEQNKILRELYEIDYKIFKTDQEIVKAFLKEKVNGIRKG